MTSSAPAANEYLAAPNQVISAANGIDYLLAGLIPQARVKIYPDAAHGFLFQHHAEFARDVDAFLTE